MCCSVGPFLSRIGRLFSAAEKSYAALRFHSPVRCSGLRQRGNRFVAEARVSVLVAEVPGGVLRSQRVEAVLAAIEQVVQHQGLTNVLHFQRCQMRQPVAAFFGFDRRQPRAVVDVKVQQQKIRDISLVGRIIRKLVEEGSETLVAPSGSLQCDDRMSTIEGGIDVRNIGTSHPLSFCVVPVGYDDRAVAFGRVDHLDLFDLMERAGAEAAKCKQKKHRREDAAQMICRHSINFLRVHRFRGRAPHDTPCAHRGGRLRGSVSVPRPCGPAASRRSLEDTRLWLSREVLRGCAAPPCLVPARAVRWPYCDPGSHEGRRAPVRICVFRAAAGPAGRPYPVRSCGSCL